MSNTSGLGRVDSCREPPITLSFNSGRWDILIPYPNLTKIYSSKFLMLSLLNC
jgi:hypothetical protein